VPLAQLFNRDSVGVYLSNFATIDQEPWRDPIVISTRSAKGIDFLLDVSISKMPGKTVLSSYPTLF
jgi:hypothetical protein